MATGPEQRSLWTPTGEVTVRPPMAFGKRREGVEAEAAANQVRMGMRRKATERQASVAQRLGSYGGGIGGGNLTSSQISLATSKPIDPMFYWRENNLPYVYWEEEGARNIRNYCNTPEAPIWMGDYSFKPIGKVQVGDTVIGWEWNQANLRIKSSLTKTRVTAIHRRMAPMVIRVTMASGRVIRCTPDHQWANPWFSPGCRGPKNERRAVAHQEAGGEVYECPVCPRFFVNERGRRSHVSQVHQIRAGLPEQEDGLETARIPVRSNDYEFHTPMVGRHLRHVIDVTPSLESEELRARAAWLGGISDGEGTANSLAQDPDYNPAVYQRIQDNLGALGLPYSLNDKGVAIRYPWGAGGAHSHEDSIKQHWVNFLNWTDPVKRCSPQWDRLILRSNFGGMDEIVSIEQEGPGEVVSMQTETGNYVAWGYASKNCNLVYMTHPVIASCIDTYSLWPLTGMHLSIKNARLEDFYGEMFFDDLNYLDYLPAVLQQVWLRGEAFPLGQFDDDLGVWEDDQMVDPDSVNVIDSPFFKESRFEMQIPEGIRQIVNERAPEWEYQQLVRGYPDIVHHAQNGDHLPVSNQLMRHLALRLDPFHPRGVSILLRAFRAIRQEEMLNAAMDAVASRLYTPLILVRLGATAADMGTDVAWVPTSDELAEFEATLDMALLGDFRVLTSSFATQIDSVFGREIMPGMNDDFDRLMDRQLMAFGLSKTLLQGADSGETYAADALNRQVVEVLLARAQRWIARFFRSRALMVAKAQEHWDYTENAGVRNVIYQDIKRTDPTSGEVVISREPKPLVPELKFDVINLRDRDMERQFVEAVRASGAMISLQTRLTNVPIDLDDEYGLFHDEQVRMAVETQAARRDAYLALKAQGLPIPQDLLDDFEPHAATPSDSSPEGFAPSVGSPSASEGLLPNAALTPIPGTMAPGPADYLSADETGTLPPDAPPGQPIFPAMAPNLSIVGDPRVPPESNEQRSRMPRGARRSRPPRSPRPQPSEDLEGNQGPLGGSRSAAERRSDGEDLDFGIYLRSWPAISDS